MTLQPLHAVLVFPKLCAALGGAEFVRHTSCFAYVKMPQAPKPVRIKLSALPPVTSWNSFNLADAVAKLPL